MKILASLFLLSLASLVSANGNITRTDFGPLEIDLIFPRNDTYEPTHLVPIVFAFQKPGQIPNNTALNMEAVIRVARPGDGPYSSVIDRLALKPDGDKGIGFFYTGYLQAFTEGTYEVSYDINWDNCTALNTLKYGHSDFLYQASGYTNSVTFTMKNGSQPMDLIAGFNKHTCHNTQSAMLQIDYMQRFPKWFRGDEFRANHPFCAVMYDSPPPAQPCNVVLTPERAHSIVQRLNESICYVPTDGTHCYEYNQKKKNDGAQLYPFSVAFVTLSLSWLLWLA